MEAIVIRWGAVGFGPPPSPATLDDVARAMDDIESGRIARPEFTLEFVTSRRLEVDHGRRSIVLMPGSPYLDAAHFLPDDESAPAGWCVAFHENRADSGPADSDEGPYLLALDDRRDAPFVEGNCCGGPLTVRSNTVVPAAAVLAAATPFLGRGERAPTLNWLPESLLYRPRRERPA